MKNRNHGNPKFIVAKWSKDLVVLITVADDFTGNAMRQVRSVIGDKASAHRIDDPNWHGQRDAYDGHWTLSSAGFDRGN